MNKTLILCLFMMLLSVDDTVTVKRKSVELREGTASYYKVVATASDGETLRVLERKGRWLKVETSGGKTGWVFETALESGGSFLSAAAKGATEIGGGQAAPADTVAGAKGLDESKRYAASHNIDYAAVERVESLTVTPGEVEAFVREGGLNPGGGQ